MHKAVAKAPAAKRAAVPSEVATDNVDKTTDKKEVKPTKTTDTRQQVTMPATLPAVESPAASSPSSAQVISNVPCCTCHRQVPRENCTVAATNITRGKNIEVYRCSQCNNSRGRVTRLLECRPKLRDTWGKLSAEGKSEFLTSTNNLLGDRLLKKLQNFVVQIVVKSKTSEFTCTGKYLDKDELETKYRDKTNGVEQLAAIYQNAETMECPNRRVMLWEDLVFSSVTTELTKEQEERKRQIMDEEKVPKAKRAKTEGTGRAQGEGAKTSALKSAEVKKLGNVKKQLDQVSAELAVLLEEVEGEKVKQFISSKISQKASASLALVQASITGIDLLVDNTNFATVVKEAEQAIATAKKMHSLLKGQIDMIDDLDS